MKPESVPNRGRSIRGSNVAPASGGALLPRFSNPPVAEVAISVQFDELARFELVHFGLFWERIRKRYPRTEHHPPLPAVVELFRTQGRASLTVESGFPIGRCWYLSDNELRLVQIQPDRFVINWRKLETEAEYPSYEALRLSFLEELDLFLSFVQEHELGQFEPTQCELTYVNHIPAGPGWSNYSELHKVLAPWTGRMSEAYLPQIENLRLAWQYFMGDKDSAFGRLHVQMQSALRNSDQHPLFVLQFSGRGAPTKGDLPGVLEFLDMSHHWIVRGFTALTTAQMHKIWGRQK